MARSAPLGKGTKAARAVFINDVDEATPPILYFHPKSYFVLGPFEPVRP